MISRPFSKPGPRYESIEVRFALSKEALKKDITLLCLEDAPDECHRRLLAEECKKINPKLEVEIK